MSPSAIDIMRLGLRGDAQKAASDLAYLHPDVVFTSGQRTRSEQACAMAANIIKAGRKWIAKTYADTIVSRTLQQWVDQHPEAKTKKALAALLVAAMALFTDDELVVLSHHFSGDAFDVQPIDGLHGNAILTALRGLVAKYRGKLITEEGGVRVWHAEFKAK